MVSVLIEEVENLPYGMGKVKIIDGRTDYNNVVNRISVAVVNFIRNKDAKDAAVFNSVEVIFLWKITC